MKKYGKIAYIMLILIIFIAGFCIYKVSAKNNSEDINEKTLAEIKYLENEFQNLFNEINNIKFENYTISATNIEEDSNNRNHLVLIHHKIMVENLVKAQKKAHQRLNKRDRRQINSMN